MYITVEMSIPTSVSEARKGCSQQELKLCRLLRLQMICLYLRVEHDRLGNLNVPALLRWQNLMSKATENNHHPFPFLGSKSKEPFPAPDTNR